MLALLIFFVGLACTMSGCAESHYYDPIIIIPRNGMIIITHRLRQVLILM
jgi:hypothetical protein